MFRNHRALFTSLKAFLGRSEVFWSRGYISASAINFYYVTVSSIEPIFHRRCQSSNSIIYDTTNPYINTCVCLYGNTNIMMSWKHTCDSSRLTQLPTHVYVTVQVHTTNPYINTYVCLYGNTNIIPVAALGLINLPMSAPSNDLSMSTTLERHIMEEGSLQT